MCSPHKINQKYLYVAHTYKPVCIEHMNRTLYSSVTIQSPPHHIGYASAEMHRLNGDGGVAAATTTTTTAEEQTVPMFGRDTAITSAVVWFNIAIHSGFSTMQCTRNTHKCPAIASLRWFGCRFSGHWDWIWWLCVWCTAHTTHIIIILAHIQLIPCVSHGAFYRCLSFSVSLYLNVDVDDDEHIDPASVPCALN